MKALQKFAFTQSFNPPKNKDQSWRNGNEPFSEPARASKLGKKLNTDGHDSRTTFGAVAVGRSSSVAAAQVKKKKFSISFAADFSRVQFWGVKFLNQISKLPEACKII